MAVQRSAARSRDEGFYELPAFDHAVPMCSQALCMLKQISLINLFHPIRDFHFSGEKNEKN